VTWDELYDDASRERLVDEPAKRVDAPERTPFERDRARVVHSVSLRRLAAKTQVLGPQADDFVRNRLTHSLEVAQIARDLAHPLGCHPDLAETAALAHDMGHPPFGHNGEMALDELAAACGGFEGNAQTLRILTRLEAKSVDPEGRSVGLNLTRATLDACTKYPWERRSGVDGVETTVKFGVYADDTAVFDWLRTGVDGPRRCVEAQVMDFADDVAYSVHDLEDGVVGGRIDLGLLEHADERAATWQTVREWYLPQATDELLDEALGRIRAVTSWPGSSYDGSRRGQAALKNLTSDLIGIFCGSVQRATQREYGDSPLVRHQADVIVPTGTAHEIAVLKGIAAHYVMRAQDRVQLMERQRTLLHELFEAIWHRGSDALDPSLRQDFAEAADDAARTRVVVDQIASLTDGSAVTRHRDLLASDPAHREKLGP
jgi:dGTPase